MSALSFRVLGPLEVTRRGRDVPVRGRMPRVLLATLLLSANRVVTTDALVDALWPGVPPRSALANLRTYACLLRSQLAADSAGTQPAGDGAGGQPAGDSPGAGPPRILTRPAGYSIFVAPGELDLTTADDLAAEASRARGEGRSRRALDLAQEALGLWRGRLLEDLPQRTSWESAAGRLARLRTSLVELTVDIRIELGQYAVAAADLRGLLAGDPLHEGWWRALVEVLHADGRTAEAVRAYDEARRVLASELGVAPGRPLQAAVAAALDNTRPRPPAPAPPAAGAPPVDPIFVGRRAAVAALVGHLTAGGRRPVVAVVTGAAGAGKSATAAQAAHLMRSAFPDGQLFLDMRGTSDAPVDPAAALVALLAGLGVPEGAIPAEPDARGALWRSRVSSLRVLVLLDDVADAATIRPLLPGPGRCALLVTSRSRSAGVPPARQVHLDALTEEEALELLGRVTGSRRLAGQPGQARRIVRACGYLPLAVRIAGAKLARHPGWSPRVLADRLQCETHRLDELRVGGLSVRDSLERSHRRLPEAAARAFGLLALLGRAPVPAWVIGALAGRPGHDGAASVLVDANLLQPAGTDAAGQARYHLPDLVRRFAAERAEERPAAERDAAVRRVLDGWLALATRARDRMPIRYFGATDSGGADSGGAASTFDARLADRLTTDAMAWFDAERHHLAAAVELAAAGGWTGHAWRLAAAAAPFFDLRGHYDDWQRAHEVALDRARRAGAVVGEAILLRDLGQLHIYRDRYGAAATAFATAGGLFASVDDPRGIGFARCGQGTVHRVRGHNRRALAAYGQALDLFLRSADRHSEAVVRSAIGRAHHALGHRTEALRWLTEAYQLSVVLGDRHREALGLHRLSLLDQDGGEHARVEADMRQALAILEELGDEHCAANVRYSIGELHFRFGERHEAGAWLAESLRAYRRLGDRRAEATVAALIGEWHSGAGRIRPARAYLGQALETWRQLAAPRQVAAVSATLRALR